MLAARLLRSGAAGTPAAALGVVQPRAWLATQHTTGPGLPSNPVDSQEFEDESRGDRQFAGDKVEDAPKPKSFKPEKQQPAAEDMNQGRSEERVRTPTSPGREQDANEPIGGPM
ncbi:zinc metalloprotease [Micractinium conductrix]|uniref:Zinc metalloprotease n=1 Tax=Micractinium conductrix TaxID=554055 RepID=A0A2P6VKY8_9CHLO|nr:zinc metalloprotease [Micractinium conductrix]|eukprot:PSC74753.1 zinc metalloprotease [Micractinium conductrix]